MATVEIPQLLFVDNSSVIEIVVQIQIRLGNSARTVALRRATAKIPNCLILTISSLELPRIAIFFFRFPCNFEKKVDSKRLVVIYPLWREKEEAGRYKWLQWS